ncbi:MAG: helix-turn-helix domain-containing protein [Egibacteraceae bacterium]
MDEDTPIGERIRYWRKKRKTEQDVLAGQVGRSTSWLSKVERGEIVMDSIKVLTETARVLKVGVWDLMPRLGLPPNGGAPLDRPKGIYAVRRAVLVDPPADREAPSADRLRADVDRVGLLVGRGSFEARAILLPELVRNARLAAAREVPGAWWCLARVYLMASGLANPFGDMALIWVALDRAVAAAQQSGDPLMVAHARRRQAFRLLRDDCLDEAGAVCSDAADAIAPTDETSPEGWSMWGSLQLTEAVAAGRGDREAEARRLLGNARAAADRVGPGRNDYWESFGPANVGAHEFEVMMQSGNVTDALRIADTVEVDEWPMAGRRAGFLVDVAYAYGVLTDDGAAIGVLLEAKRQSEEIVRYSVKAHELVRVCLDREKRYRTPGLRDLAKELKIPH